MQHEARQAHRHDRRLGGLDQPHQGAALEAVGDLSGQGRDQEEGQDVEARSQHAELSGPIGRVAEDPVAGQHQKAGLEQVVVEGPEQVGREQGREADLGQKREGRGHGGGSRRRGGQFRLTPIGREPHN